MAVTNSPLISGTADSKKSHTLKKKINPLPQTPSLYSYECDDCVFGSPTGNIKMTTNLSIIIFVQTLRKALV
jgi:hypothetical protein